MSTVLTNGIIIPDNGSRNWGGDLANNWNIIDLNVGYMTDVKNRVTTLENSVAENSANIQINTSNISALQTSKQDTIEDLETIRAGASSGATAVQPSTLNNYVDLSSEQTISGAKTFTSQIVGSINKAEKDLGGNIITSTYATKSELANKANDSDVVHKSGDEFIRGIKNFNNVVLGEQDGVIRIGNNGQGAHFSTLNYDGVFYNNIVKQFVPKTNNEYNLGTSTNKWKDVYATTFNGNLVGNITGNADTATKDANGCKLSGVVESGTNYIRYSNGIQLCWGTVVISETSGRITFPKPFAHSSFSPPITCFGDRPLYENYFNVNNWDPNSFSIERTGQPGNARFNYICIGLWI